MGGNTEDEVFQCAGCYLEGSADKFTGGGVLSWKAEVVRREDLVCRYAVVTGARSKEEAEEKIRDGDFSVEQTMEEEVQEWEILDVVDVKQF